MESGITFTLGDIGTILGSKEEFGLLLFAHEMEHLEWPQITFWLSKNFLKCIIFVELEPKTILAVFMLVINCGNNEVNFSADFLKWEWDYSNNPCSRITLF